MDDFNFDTSVLQAEFTRVTEDKKKPQGQKKTGTFYDKFVKMPKQEGYVILRLLGPIPGKDLPYCACRVHNLGTPEKANNIYCGRSLNAEGKWVGECFTCEYYNHLYRLRDAALEAGREEEAEQLKNKAQFIKPQDKYYYNAIVKASDPPTGQSEADGPLIYSCGITLHTFILEACLGNKKMNKKPKGNVFHPINGRDLQIVKKMKPGGKFPDYSGCEWLDPSPISEDEAQVKKWLSGMNDVFALKNVLSVDEMKYKIRVFEGKEQDTRKSFDASFLEDNTAPSVSASVPTGVPVSVGVQEIPDEDGGIVDGEIADAVRAALGQD